MKQSIEAKISGSLNMNQNLQQAIKMLQMSTIDLNQFIVNQIENNPLLEIEYIAKSNEDNDINYGNNNDYADYQDNHSFQGYDNEKDEYCTNVKLKTELNLQDSLKQQLYLSGLSNKQNKIALILMQNLNNSGYLDVNIDDLALQLKVEQEEILDVLSVLQTFEPCGIFARDLKECIKIQLREKGELNFASENILNNIDDILNLSPNVLAKKCNISVDVLQHYLKVFKNLNPKPTFGIADNNLEQIIMPDAFVTKQNDDFILELNESVIPKVIVNSSYYDSLKKQLFKIDDKVFLKEKISQANWLINALHQRLSTFQQVSEFIVNFQKDFFKKGLEYLKPLTLKQASDALGFHESTISRITNDKYLLTPQGLLELKFFFSQSLISLNEDKQNISSKTVQNTINGLIKIESKQYPFSDEQIVAKLEQKGIIIARRTIAKYRNILNIPSSSERKNMYTLGIKPNFC